MHSNTERYNRNSYVPLNKTSTYNCNKNSMLCPHLYRTEYDKQQEDIYKKMLENKIIQNKLNTTTQK